MANQSPCTACITTIQAPCRLVAYLQESPHHIAAARHFGRRGCLIPALSATQPAFSSVAAMPPRRSRLSQALEASSATISWLSDDLLAKCFAPLDQNNR